MQKDLFARTINGKSTEICSTRHCGVNFIGFGNDWEILLEADAWTLMFKYQLAGYFFIIAKISFESAVRGDH